MFRHGGTSERDVGAPLMPFNALTAHRPPRKAYPERNVISWLAVASDSRRGTDECALPPLDIRVWAIQLSPYRAGVAGLYPTRLLIPPAFLTCCCSLALSGLGKSVASESFALNSGHLWWQFAPCVTRRTVSLQWAIEDQRGHANSKVQFHSPCA